VQPRTKRAAISRDLGFDKQSNGINWKWQYKLRHNWTKGSCTVKEVHVAAEASIPPILARLHDGTIYMADKSNGLRAWSVNAHHVTAQLPLPNQAPPSSLAVAAASAGSSAAIVVVGHEDGSFAVLALRSDLSALTVLHNHQGKPTDAVITAIALSWPYVVTLTATQNVTLYNFNTRRAKAPLRELASPTVLHTLTSRTIWPPLCISIRTSTSSVTVSIAFALPTYLSGWTVGIQEISIDLEGTFLSSRVASAIEEHFRPLTFASRPMFPHIVPFQPNFPGITSTRETRHIHSKPMSLSYTHPYLLVSHPDNTLTIYLVTSTAESLFVGPGSRLWGHTSSVSGAHVGRRGKAVSISKRGDELRVWELEGGFSSLVAKKRLTDHALSVKIRPDQVSQDGLTISSNTPRDLDGNEQSLSDLSITRGWIGFDEEKVVFLREEGQGKQILVIYDFT
jgi:hypothetical protein